MGFPDRSARVDFGPEMKNVRPPVIADTDLSAEQMNLTFWQTAGAGRVVPMAIFTYDGVNDVILTQAAAFDPRQELSAPITAAKTGTGLYEFTFAGTYQNERGADRPFVPRAALAFVQGGAATDFAHVFALDGSQVVSISVLQPGPVAVDATVFVLVW